jgi:hypothetical protein
MSDRKIVSNKCTYFRGMNIPSGSFLIFTKIFVDVHKFCVYQVTSDKLLAVSLTPVIKP